MMGSLMAQIALMRIKKWIFHKEMKGSEYGN